MTQGVNFDVYRLLIEEAREARRARRDLANIFTTMNLAGASVLAGGFGGGAIEASGAAMDLMRAPIAIVLGLVCLIWRQSMLYYNKVLSAKYEVIYAYEDALSIDPMQREWNSLQKGGRTYFSFERTMPWVFGFGYIGYLVLLADWSPVVWLVQDFASGLR